MQTGLEISKNDLTSINRAAMKISIGNATTRSQKSCTRTEKSGDVFRMP